MSVRTEAQKPLRTKLTRAQKEPIESCLWYLAKGLDAHSAMAFLQVEESKNLRGNQEMKELRIQSNFHPGVLSVILLCTVFFSYLCEKIYRQNIL